MCLRSLGTSDSSGRDGSPLGARNAGPEVRFCFKAASLLDVFAAVENRSCGVASRIFFALPTPSRSGRRNFSSCAELPGTEQARLRAHTKTNKNVWVLDLEIGEGT